MKPRKQKAIMRGGAFALSIVLVNGSARGQQFVCSYISSAAHKPEVSIETYTLEGNLLIQGYANVKFAVVQNTANGIVAIYPDPEMRFSMVVMINRQTGSFTLNTAPGVPIVDSSRVDGKCKLP